MPGTTQTELHDALLRLCDEVDASWGEFEPELRYFMGSANYQRVSDRMARAREILERVSV
jgi:hypothetical protein